VDHDLTSNLALDEYHNHEICLPEGADIVPGLDNSTGIFFPCCSGQPQLNRTLALTKMLAQPEIKDHLPLLYHSERRANKDFTPWSGSKFLGVLLLFVLDAPQVQRFNDTHRFSLKNIPTAESTLNTAQHPRASDMTVSTSIIGLLALVRHSITSTIVGHHLLSIFSRDQALSSLEKLVKAQPLSETMADTKPIPMILPSS
jgi:hypothetical protein